ncbi:hypothetical protein R2917_002126 [Salmonella enterica]|nr:hypothetical protein [Salmonella enterica]ELQ8582491.1 hypothetical protein [Salmonella enterica]
MRQQSQQMMFQAYSDVMNNESCNCIKTDPLSAQAWRGKHCAPALVRNNKNYRLSAPWWCRRGCCRFVGGRVCSCACGASEA